MSESKLPKPTPAWDRIIERDQQATRDLDDARQRTPAATPQLGNLRIAIFAAAWADTMCLVAVCTLGLGALVLMGHRANLTTLPWGLALGLLWWVVAGTACLVVRRGTPGMLMAGIVSRETIPPQRVPITLMSALLSSLLGGVPAFLGRRRSLLHLGLGQELIASQEVVNTP